VVSRFDDAEEVWEDEVDEAKKTATAAKAKTTQKATQAKNTAKKATN